MQEVNVLTVNLRRVLRNVIESLFLRSPVELGTPVVGQLPEIAARNATTPAGTRNLARPPGVRQPRVQVIDVGLRDVNAELVDRHAASLSGHAERFVPHRMAHLAPCWTPRPGCSACFPCCKA